MSGQLGVWWFPHLYTSASGGDAAIGTGDQPDCHHRLRVRLVVDELQRQREQPAALREHHVRSWWRLWAVHTRYVVLQKRARLDSQTSGTERLKVTTDLHSRRERSQQIDGH